MTPKYELVYFNIRGLAEMTRLLLTDQDIEFQDTQISDREEWAKVKENFSFGQIPCLKENGKTDVVQTGAIMRHLARVHNLGGDSECEKTFADMFFEGIRDLHSKYGPLIYVHYDEPGKKEEFLGTTLPTALAQLEKLFKTHANGEKFVLGEKISYVDYTLFEELDVMLVLDTHFLDNFALLKAFHERMAARPNLKAYLEKRAASGIKINGNGKQ
ncbi:hypothetical protein L596_015242 [Steinernema carpocapsae]|uniref:Glutathione S-transferase n=1 Tax=Steinernema carpocapsae TaxID=34508 RepID=A0A4U5NFC1_STECR|nr:hypothetical protein L596_015242 [Steinernema carpocapsae]